MVTIVVSQALARGEGKPHPQRQPLSSAVRTGRRRPSGRPMPLDCREASPDCSVQTQDSIQTQRSRRALEPWGSDMVQRRVLPTLWRPGCVQCVQWRLGECPRRCKEASPVTAPEWRTRGGLLGPWGCSGHTQRNLTRLTHALGRCNCTHCTRASGPQRPQQPAGTLTGLLGTTCSRYRGSD